MLTKHNECESTSPSQVAAVGLANANIISSSLFLSFFVSSCNKTNSPFGHRRNVILILCLDKHVRFDQKKRKKINTCENNANTTSLSACSFGLQDNSNTYYFLGKPMKTVEEIANHILLNR